ncbi:MAG: beta-lactamase family protein [Deltaproteobacteria bacterium]|nr:beta-lactamase family protein [Deltaproteobacteria bacterium]
MDLSSRISRLPLIRSTRCRVPEELESVITVGEETPPQWVGITSDAIEGVWERILDLYRSGTQPAIQACIRCQGQVVLDRAVGHASGNGPSDPPDAPKRRVGLDTPINIFSASKAVTAMLIHKLVEQRKLALDDRVCEYVPGFERHGKGTITLRHVLAHRAGLPSLPEEALDLDLLGKPKEIIGILCEQKVQSRPGRVLAYHAVTGGFILAEVARQACGRALPELLHDFVSEPLGLECFAYGIAPERISEVAINAYTGPPAPPPLAQSLKRALGTDMRTVVDLSNDPRFLTGVIPSANLVTTAREASLFYQCLLEQGQHEGRTVFERRTIHHATAEQSWWELDLTLMLPLRYGLGFMLGNPRLGPFGSDNEAAFGHIGFSNVFTWADPERRIAVALLTTGKPVVSLHIIPLFAMLTQVSRAFPKLDA